MFDTITDGLATLGYPELLEGIKEAEEEISRQRAHQLRLLRELRRRSPFGRGVTPTDIAGRLDIAPKTARSLFETADRSPEDSQRMNKLDTGEWSFDRSVAMAQLFAAGADEETMRTAADRDITGVHKLKAMTKRIRRRDERVAHEERHVRSFASLDESVGFINVQLGAYDWQLVNQALDDRADQFPRQAQEWTREQRRADALVAISQDWLGSRLRPRRSSGPLVTVMVDAETAAATDCEAGVTLTGGPRIGPDTLDRLMCEGSVEIIVDPGTGRPLAVGPTTRVIPPKMRRFILNRDNGCTINGCDGRYRLEVHHIIPRSQDGNHDEENLTTLCWWHHHIAIHQRGYQIDPTSPPRRREIIPQPPTNPDNQC